jgi:hypothetical protein
MVAEKSSSYGNRAERGMKTREARTRWTVIETSERTGASQGFVVHCLEQHWVRTEAAKAPLISLLSEEDVARVRLIHELQEIFGANDESIPLILHLLDQVYSLVRTRR